MTKQMAEDRLAMLQIYCERHGLALPKADDAASAKVLLILGELVCELDMMKAGLKMAGRERK